MTWLERAAADPSLRAYVDAEIARAHVELQALRAEYAHQRRVIAAQAAEIANLRKALPAMGRQRALKGEK